MDKREIYIYTLTDPRDNLVKYIGKTYRINRRLNEHIYKSKESNTPKNAWIKNLSNYNLTPILEVLEICSIDESNDLEIYWISQFKSWGYELKNYTNGGDGSYGINPWNKGLKGVFKHSEETKKLMSNKRKGFLKGENNGFYGKNHTKENIELFRKLSGERKWTENMFNRMSGINSDNCKKVYCYDLKGKLIKVYDYGKQTEEDGFDSNSVSKACRGIYKTHKNYIFSFVKIENFKKEDYLKKEQIGIKSKSCKKVYCYDLDMNLVKVYDYGKQTKEDGFDPSCVSSCCLGKSKTHKKHIFTFNKLI